MMLTEMLQKSVKYYGSSLIPHSYISRVSNATTRRRCKATRFSIQILRSQLRWLGHILRREPTDPLRLVVFEPNAALLPRFTGTGRKKLLADRELIGPKP